ncbi:MAG: tRNA threonylcarbamoyladenosine dehydratase [Eubacterium sp.]|nr:tRNA threonylcarbamoyladenosine dehydratase [Eubacterium sp.]
MSNWYDRTAMVLGEEAIEKLNRAHVAVFGVGGVGGYVVEALARSGIGAIDIIDKDTVDVTNINRQIIATNDTVGKVKVEVMKERIESINPGCLVNAFQLFYLPETADEIHLGDYDYVVDAIDNVTAKLTLIENAYKEKVPIISAMGAGNKLDPSRFRVADIYSTSVCPLAKVMRRELKKRGISKLKVVYSDEEPIKSVPTASVPFVPPVAGLIMAGEVVKDLSLREADLP